MAYEFETFLDATQKAEDTERLNALLYEAITLEGYENLVFVSLGGKRPLTILSDHLPVGYLDAYHGNGWASLDPILRESRSARQPFTWESVAGQPGVSGEQKRFFAACESIGVHSGVTLPFHNPDGSTHIMSISRRRGVRHDHGRISYLYALAAQTWVRHNALAADVAHGAAPICLTSRERECLLWAKGGKTNWEISRILSVAERTVEFHIGNAMRKLNATNRVTAIVIALQEGLIKM